VQYDLYPAVLFPAFRRRVGHDGIRVAPPFGCDASGVGECVEYAGHGSLGAGQRKLKIRRKLDGADWHIVSVANDLDKIRLAFQRSTYPLEQ
jgi:hypothetical protein